MTMQADGDRSPMVAQMRLTSKFKPRGARRSLTSRQGVAGGRTAAIRRRGERARCREVERTIRELRSQANELRRELRRIERSSPVTSFETNVDLLIAQAEAELWEFEIIRDFVRSFRDAKSRSLVFCKVPTSPTTTKKKPSLRLLARCSTS
jgi:hypothetical protein